MSNFVSICDYDRMRLALDRLEEKDGYYDHITYIRNINVVRFTLVDEMFNDSIDFDIIKFDSYDETLILECTDTRAMDFFKSIDDYSSICKFIKDVQHAPHNILIYFKV